MEHNWREVLSELAGKARLLVVSKTHPADEIRALYQLGQRDFGENRVQEIEEKDPQLADCPELRWHLIGNLQSNKIPKLNKLSRLHAIHSVDTAELAQKLAKSLSGHYQGVDLYLQMNTSHEDEKAGFEDFFEIQQVAQGLKNLRNVTLRGLMTMGTLRTDAPEKEAHRCFEELRIARDTLSKTLEIPLELSMGMSGDYAIALQHGTDWVRVGSKIFKA